MLRTQPVNIGPIFLSCQFATIWLCGKQQLQPEVCSPTVFFFYLSRFDEKNGTVEASGDADGESVVWSGLRCLGVGRFA